MPKRRVEQGQLDKWRELDAAEILQRLAEHAKSDSTFVPLKNQKSTRWHATVEGREYEILCTGPKFWDTRAEKGGGGAVDLVMHLSNVDFRTATEMLRTRGI
jgi:hypothetical protein